MGENPNTTIQPSEYFLQALEAQRSINSHIHEIEPSTPVFLYEIDLNEIKPAMVSYPNRNGPVKDGVIRVHNDFNNDGYTDDDKFGGFGGGSFGGGGAGSDF